jgi:hypothetical protein
VKSSRSFSQTTQLAGSVHLLGSVSSDLPNFADQEVCSDPDGTSPSVLALDPRILLLHGTLTDLKAQLHEIKKSWDDLQLCFARACRTIHSQERQIADFNSQLPAGGFVTPPMKFFAQSARGDPDNSWFLEELVILPGTVLEKRRFSEQMKLTCSAFDSVCLQAYRFARELLPFSTATTISPFMSGDEESLGLTLAGAPSRTIIFEATVHCNMCRSLGFDPTAANATGVKLMAKDSVLEIPSRLREFGLYP